MKKNAFFVLIFLSLSLVAEAKDKVPSGLCTDKDIPILNFHTVLLEGLPAQEAYDCESGKTARGLVYRGSQPSKIGIEALIKLGVKTILNLEGEGKAKEEEAIVDGRMNFISKPMSGGGASSDKTVEDVVQILRNPDNYPIYIHCKRGRDRTGFTVGLLRVLDGWHPNRANDEWNIYRDLISKTLSHRQRVWGKKKIQELFEKLN